MGGVAGVVAGVVVVVAVVLQMVPLATCVTAATAATPSVSPRFDSPPLHWTNMTTAQIVRDNGYNCETHEVVTQDGYILEVHRITTTITTTITQPPPPPLLLHHCLLCSSSVFVMNTPDRALGYILADAGYDVWMTNARGNTYSKKHTHLSIEEKTYWDFSWHEMGKYDVPAVIDHILAETNHTQLGYVGYSMGTTVFWVLMSERPEYREKIKFMVGMGPVAFLQNVKGTLKYLAPFVNFIEGSLSLAGRYEFMSFGPKLDHLTSIFCSDRLFTSAICHNILFLIAGPNAERLNKRLLPILLSHTPAGTSLKTITHYLQLINSGSFRQYDHGRLYDLAYYGSLTPPSYDLSSVSCPVALFYSASDWLADGTDVKRLEMSLPNVVVSKMVKADNFGHLDFVWASDARELVYEDVLKILKEYY